MKPSNVISGSDDKAREELQKIFDAQNAGLNVSLEALSSSKKAEPISVAVAEQSGPTLLSRNRANAPIFRDRLRTSLVELAQSRTKKGRTFGPRQTTWRSKLLALFEGH